MLFAFNSAILHAPFLSGLSYWPSIFFIIMTGMSGVSSPPTERFERPISIAVIGFYCCWGYVAKYKVPLSDNPIEPFPVTEVPPSYELLCHWVKTNLVRTKETRWPKRRCMRLTARGYVLISRVDLCYFWRLREEPFRRAHLTAMTSPTERLMPFIWAIKMAATAS